MIRATMTCDSKTSGYIVARGFIDGVVTNTFLAETKATDYTIRSTQRQSISSLGKVPSQKTNLDNKKCNYFLINQRKVKICNKNPTTTNDQKDEDVNFDDSKCPKYI